MRNESDMEIDEKTEDILSKQRDKKVLEKQRSIDREIESMKVIKIREKILRKEEEKKRKRQLSTEKKRKKKKSKKDKLGLSCAKLRASLD